MIGLGFLIMAWSPLALALAAVFGAVYFGYYMPYKDRIESARLESLYGDAYRRYAAAVPRLIPASARLRAARRRARPRVELARHALQRQQRDGHGGRGGRRRPLHGGALEPLLARGDLEGPRVAVLNLGGWTNPDVLLVRARRRDRRSS